MTSETVASLSSGSMGPKPMTSAASSSNKRSFSARVRTRFSASMIWSNRFLRRRRTSSTMAVSREGSSSEMSLRLTRSFRLRCASLAWFWAALGRKVASGGGVDAIAAVSAGWRVTGGLGGRPPCSSRFKSDTIQINLAVATAHRHWTKQIGPNGAGQPAIDTAGQEDLARSGAAHQSGGNVDRVAQDSKLRALRRPQHPQYDPAASETRATFQTEAPVLAPASIERFVGANHPERGGDGALAVVRLVGACSERGEQAIANELLHHSAAAGDGAHRHCQVLVDDAHHPHRIVGKALHQPREVAQVREQGGAVADECVFDGGRVGVESCGGKALVRPPQAVESGDIARKQKRLGIRHGGRSWCHGRPTACSTTVSSSSGENGLVR